MEKTRCDAYCGLYCGACEIVHAETAQEKARVAEKWGATPEQVACKGCKGDTLFIHCANCKIRNCARQKEIEFCIECDAFPCSVYKEGKAIIDHLPHLKATVVNQRYIKEHGVGPWLEEQKTKWACPQCGAGFAWYTPSCKQCGHDLAGIKDYEKLSDRDIGL